MKTWDVLGAQKNIASHNTCPHEKAVFGCSGRFTRMWNVRRVHKFLAAEWCLGFSIDYLCSLKKCKIVLIFDEIRTYALLP